MATKGFTFFFFTKNLEEQKNFYQKALGIEPQQHGPDWCQFQIGDEVSFALHGCNDEMRVPLDWPFFSFNVDDLEASLEAFKIAGAEIVRGIQDEDFGRSAQVKDAEGREYQLVQHGR